MSNAAMRVFLTAVAMLLLMNSARCSDAERKPLDDEFLRNYMTGEYDRKGERFLLIL